MNAFELELNQICNFVAQDVRQTSPEVNYFEFIYAATQEQLKKVNPCAKSYSIVMQLICTNFK